MKSLTVIIPIHKYDDIVGKFFDRAIRSIDAMEGSTKVKVMIVGPKDVLKKAEETFNKGKHNSTLTLVENDKTDMFEQINKGAYGCTTKYFTVLEFDDAFTPKWFNKVDKYMEAGTKYSLFMPLNRTVDESENNIGLLNEIAWSSSFAENNTIDDLGTLTIEELEGFMDFNVTGSIINTEDFISVGGLKPSLKIAAWYEFLLRMCKNSKNIYVIPFIGYVHTIGRADSYMVNAKESITAEEGQWLITTARQEYFHKKDRNKEFKKEGEE